MNKLMCTLVVALVAISVPLHVRVAHAQKDSLHTSSLAATIAVRLAAEQSPGATDAGVAAQESMVSAAVRAAGGVTLARQAAQPAPQRTRSLIRTLGGVALSAGGGLFATSAVRQINSRNTVRNQWNENADVLNGHLARWESINCYYSDPAFNQCVLESLDTGTALVNLSALSNAHDFLPASFSFSQAYNLNDDDVRRLAVRVELERRIGPKVIGGLAAAGVGVLLATIWSDVPVVNAVRLSPQPGGLLASSAVSW